MWNAFAAERFSASGASAATIVVMMFAGWLVSRRRRDVSIVDTLWGAAITLAGSLAYCATAGEGTERRRALVLSALTLWGVRLSTHLSIRHAAEGPDRRYAKVGRPSVVFGLQGVLAFVVALPVTGVMADRSATPVGPLDLTGIGVALLGLTYETTADLQLQAHRARRKRPDGTVLDTGLWRYSRHPNYFGEALFWIGLTLPALTVGAYWAVVSPVLMLVLLLRVSGVSLMERTIVERRPAYRAYAARTSAFFPWLPGPPPVVTPPPPPVVENFDDPPET